MLTIASLSGKSEKLYKAPPESMYPGAPKQWVHTTDVMMSRHFAQYKVEDSVVKQVPFESYAFQKGAESTTSGPSQAPFLQVFFLYFSPLQHPLW